MYWAIVYYGILTLYYTSGDDAVGTTAIAAFVANFVQFGAIIQFHL